MTVTVKASRNLGTKNRLEVLRVQLVAGEMAKQIGERIRQARMDAGFHRQRDLADKIEDIAREEGADVPIDNQRISDWERGVNKPSDRYMELLAKAVGRDVGWFYGRDKRATPDLFPVTEQLDDVDAKFSERVDEIEARLERIERVLTDSDKGILALLARQESILADIRTLVGDQDAFAPFREALAREAAAAEATQPSPRTRRARSSRAAS